MFVRDVYNTEDFKGVPRDPGDGGALLHDRWWARELRVNDSKGLLIGPAIIAMGIATMATVAWVLVSANKHRTRRDGQRLVRKGR